MRKINEIIVHCTATAVGKNFKAADIDRWHRDRDMRCIGYHHVVDLDGKERFKADRKLLDGMLAKSDKARYVLWTVGYYYAVRAFGWLFFNYKDKKKDAKKY